jgi:hypothetical protein
MKVELSLMYITLLAIVPALIVFIAMRKKFADYEKEIKKRDEDNLLLHHDILELEQELVAHNIKFNKKEHLPSLKSIKSA